MKRFPISAILLVLTWCGIIFGLMARKFELPFHGDMFDLNLQYMQDEQLVENQEGIIETLPAWDYANPNPPMGARTAIQRAELFRRQHISDIPGKTWKMESAEVCPVVLDKALWCWCVRFGSFADDDPNDEGKSISIYVMPTGKVVHAIRDDMLNNKMMIIQDSLPN